MGFKKNRDCTIRVAKKKALISFAVTAKLICAFVFAYADCWFVPMQIVGLTVYYTHTVFCKHSHYTVFCDWQSLRSVDTSPCLSQDQHVKFNICSAINKIEPPHGKTNNVVSKQV